MNCIRKQNKEIIITLLATLFILSSCKQKNNVSAVSDKKPNIILIFTDQQNINMMGVMGNTQIKTPNMDRLANKGFYFKNSYCVSPVCGPARSSIITGLMPHETDVEWNGSSIKEGVLNAGEIFRKAGYETIWGGKWHLPESYPLREGSVKKEIKGFKLLPFGNFNRWMLGSELDPPLADAAVNFIKDYDSEKPFFLSLSFHNPHDICFYPRKDGWATETDSLLKIRYYGFKYLLPEVIRTHPSKITDLPPLPKNFEINPNEPEFLSDKRKYHTEYGMETRLSNLEFDELDWRGYLNAYNKLTESVDVEIGKVIDALEENNLLDNSIIVFTSDHGDGAAAHRWSAKLSLYNESVMVPLIIVPPKKERAVGYDNTSLVSQIDILPTLCDYAEVEVNHKFTGKSLKPLLQKREGEFRNYIVSELADFKPDKSRKGRMVRSQKYKYIIYTTGARNEQLFDLQNDPGETKNLAQDMNYSKVKEEHRGFLHQWMEKTNDNNFDLPTALELTLN